MTRSSCLYTYAGFHGSGVGTALLAAVIDDNAPAALWVAHPNPRAQAFYRKNGFVTDEAVNTEDEVCGVRVVRQPKQQTCQTSRPEHCVSKPLGNETSQRVNSRFTSTVTDFRRNSGSGGGKGNSRIYVLQPSGKNRVPIVSFETRERA
ncbi:GNAT family N-acetyltransferase [Pseudarthrobacter sp. CCNWLW207]|uniref:GNAT family N-acetyltransferase n=1 Tax=Pseudarthrobacter sp. CCNWLW207 TaxID=3127468 RepID=UPI0030780A24